MSKFHRICSAIDSFNGTVKLEPGDRVVLKSKGRVVYGTYAGIYRNYRDVITGYRIENVPTRTFIAGKPHIQYQTRVLKLSTSFAKVV